ncbi:hypothetical protein [Halorussus sp. AFM4]|uniref:hypothetical protein n=1 Tax=Halorussus sp. AFM4 TaxID=3421651 RepID=UPI003EC07600
MDWDEISDGDAVVVKIGDIEAQGNVTVEEEVGSFRYEIPISHEELPDVDAIRVSQDDGDASLVAFIEDDSMKYTTPEDFEFRRLG